MKRREFLKSSAQAAVWLGLANSLGADRFFPQDRAAFDLIIKGGTVIDGFSDSPFRADVGITGEKIIAVGELQAARAGATIDASGRVVTPGFIDIHTHTGIELLVNPKGESKIRQGVTTELSGNCGGSEFPREKEPGPGERKSLEKLNLKLGWVDLGGYRDRLSRDGIGLNHATLVGHGTVRAYIMGEEKRPPTSAELDRMKKLIAEAMQQGAFGLSSGLEYTPGGFADIQEMISLCRVAAEYGGFYATHIRSEDSRAVEAVAEAVAIAATAGLPLEISHFKVCGTTNWWKMPMMFDLIERAKERGLEVTADAYPYLAYNTGLSVFFPQWALDGGDEAFVARLKSPETRRRMKPEAMEKLEGTPWENILLVDLETEGNKRLIGQTIGQAAARNQDPYEFACDLLIQEGGDVSIIGFGMSEENTVRVLRHPQVMVASDGSALAPYGPLRSGIPHPRNYGTYPRFLGHYVREKKILTLPEAVKKVSSLPAAKLGLKDRGIVRKGAFADLVVFDADRILDKATYTEPEKYPEGIDYVIVNGRVVVDHDRHTGALPGKFLLGPGRKG
ncbi:MAG: D-aminoacylase [Candidatus Aminicenantes bacterium]|nr:D-aminoacylase [Candidatus Aminicenantes bacterium]